MTACLSFHKHHVLRQFCSGMRRNQNLEFLDEKVTYIFRLFSFFNFFHFSFFAFSYLFCGSDWPSTGLTSSLKISEKAS